MCRVLLIAASRRAHVRSTCFLFQAAVSIGSGPWARGDPIRGPDVLGGPEELSNPAGVEVFGDPQGPTERPTALCRVEASRIGMQPRSPTGEAVPGIGNDFPVHDHDAQ